MRGVYFILISLAMISVGLRGVEAASVMVPVSSLKRVSMTVPAARYVDDMKAVDLGVAERKVEAYFNGITTLQAEFSQKVQGEDFGSEGTFYWKKPRQFLWQYETPVKQKVVGTGTVAYYVDESVAGGRGQVTQLPLNAGLGRLFAAKKLDLAAQGLKMLEAKENTQVFKVALQFIKPTEADMQAGVRQVVLVFDKRPSLVIQKIEAVDMTGAVTRVSFADVVVGKPLAASLFAFMPGVYDER